MLQGGLLLLISILALFLCSWIIIPAPIFSLLPLSVATPEISPALLSFNLLLLLVLTQQSHKPKLALSLALVALILSALPLAQLPKAQAQADRHLTTFLNSIQKSVNVQDIRVQNIRVQNIRSKAFSLRDFISGIPQSPIRETQNLTFTSDNTQLSLNLYRPSSPGPNPTIVTIYGGAWQRGNPNSDAVFNRYLASQGYTVWAISYRHAPAYTFPTQLQDVQAALRFIQTHAIEYEVDLNHIALVGRSAGAQLASLAAYGASPFPIQAIVNYYGPVNLTSGYYNLPTPDPIDSRSVLTAFLGGTPAEFPDRYIQASPINSVKPGLPPSLLIYGGRDHIVESRFGKHLAETLTQNQNPVLFIEIPWADHAFDAVFQGVSNQFALYYVDRFLAATLKN
jgi:acetyl esterase/lipase